MGKPVYLGKVKFRWCDNCNVPLVGEYCYSCGSIGRKVKITPPGEVRIGFEGDLKILNEVLNRQFGCSLDDRLVLFNRVPHRDRMDEVIVDGHVIGNLRYDPELFFFIFTLRLEGAYLLNSCAKKGIVVADEGAIEPILSGKNLMVPGVRECSDGIEKGDEIIVRDPSGRAFAVGIAKMNSEEMKRERRGVAVKIRYAGYGELKLGKKAGIEEVIKANEEHLKKIENEAVEFIKKVSRENDLPLAVSFSGGKDSLATLLLAMESGLDFHVFFLDTGIELPETIEYVNEIEKKYGLNIDKISAGDAFWKSLEVFGPPARDYRWCCKVTKLGPTTRYILENYPKGLLTLIGQRRYESEERMKKGRVWKNEWVPNQLSASPIQNWSSLEVWLYILWKKAPFNLWYSRGLTRIGCYLCPSSDLADFEIVKGNFKGLERWENYLRQFALEHGISEEWAHSSWRWRKPPRWAGTEKVRRDYPHVRFEGDTWKRVNIDRNVDEERIKNMLFALPPGTWKFEEKLEVREDEEKEAKSLILRAIGCVGCGVCLGRCPTNALYLDEEKKIKIKEELCVHCLDCMGPCPAENF